MPEFRERCIVANGIHQHVTEAGSGPVVLLCHGFPEVGYSWRHQLRALADAGFHAIAPDMRGYGRTDVPQPTEQYTIYHLVGDMVGLLAELGIGRADIVGHDWGAPVAWAAAQLRPDLFASVTGMCVPFTPRRPVSRLDAWRRSGRTEFYQLYFQEPGRAEEEFEQDIAATLRRMMWTLSAGPSARWDGMIGPSGALAALAEPERPMHWMSDAELAVYIAAFERSGFAGPLKWYRNIERNWELTAPLQGVAIHQPAWFITGEHDPIYPLMKPLVDALPHTVPGHRGSTIVAGAGHWVQQEAPGAVNAVLIDFLRTVHA
ncbi:pimeloyl-ACP methyl ester carboxylesterase [Pseudoduganella flava]|uniref:Alpha/beta fold hydrolase n=1 Tax=Pseudoduganella flava TaxID=871742 RepID=A0A562Q0K9_9BURK|nr:alpha/beta hydrolase [Pseudoduganella flava]QGZ38256.1 alpha/beta fold hydrolase [Pseudoduganella flava]TWI50209.1 pimeloyl-ACP methyl ester carboxylesterase [Pseudoduganella flava]